MKDWELAEALTMAKGVLAGRREDDVCELSECWYPSLPILAQALIASMSDRVSGNDTDTPATTDADVVAIKDASACLADFAEEACGSVRADEWRAEIVGAAGRLAARLSGAERQPREAREALRKIEKDAALLFALLDVSAKRFSRLSESPHGTLVGSILKRARAVLDGSADGNAEAAKPEGWPDKCGRCGAPWERLSFDPADGFCCSSCGGCDSDE